METRRSEIKYRNKEDGKRHRKRFKNLDTN